MISSRSFSVWITRRVKGVDLRDTGSGHATTTNTIRQAGFGWGALVFVLDFLKGYIPTYLAVHARQEALLPYIIVLTAALAVAGHCWPVFAGFRGGMGLTTMGGAMLAVNTLAFLICVAILIVLVLVVRHSARATVFAGILAAPILWVCGIRDISFWIALVGGLIIIARFMVDWNRTYRELWLDRAKGEKPPA